jgi:hypothetical protein
MSADDRSRLESLLAALDASPRALRREPLDGRNKPDGDPTDYAIIGKHGHIYADGAGFLIYVSTHESARRWGFIKKRLGFGHLTQDGGDEGCLHLDRLPTPAEAALIREAIGIRQRRHLSAGALAALERARNAVGEPHQPQAFV